MLFDLELLPHPTYPDNGHLYVDIKSAQDVLFPGPKRWKSHITDLNHLVKEARKGSRWDHVCPNGVDDLTIPSRGGISLYSVHSLDWYVGSRMVKWKAQAAKVETSDTKTFMCAIGFKTQHMQTLENKQCVARMIYVIEDRDAS